MIKCTFELNGSPLSSLNCDTLSLPAFSGFGRHVNRREDSCLVAVGPIPPGAYYIVDRQSGGFLGNFRDLLNDRREWFALYAADEKVDDEMYCSKVRRGCFRLHPKGPLGISEGCITIETHADFHRLRAILKRANLFNIPGPGLTAYGMVAVK